MNIALLLLDAKKSHENLVDELRVIFDRLDPELKSDRFDDKLERLVVPFDLMLQYEMLHIALQSQSKKRDFLIFIRSMDVFSYDILRFGEEYAAVRPIDIEISYEKCLHDDKEENERLLGILKAGVTPLWEDALAALTKSDLVIEKDVYQILEDNLLRIIDCFLMVDEEISDTEIRQMMEGVRLNMLAPIVEANEELFRRSVK